MTVIHADGSAHTTTFAACAGTLQRGPVRQPATHTTQHQRARVGLIQGVRLLRPHGSSSSIPFARKYAEKRVRVGCRGDHRGKEEAWRSSKHNSTLQFRAALELECRGSQPVQDTLDIAPRGHRMKLRRYNWGRGGGGGP